MTESLPATAQALAILRERLVRGALAAGVPSHEVDDVADRAIWKASRERLRVGAPGFATRAGAALRDEVVEYFRRASARPEIDYEVDVPESPQPPEAQRRLEFRELMARLRVELSRDELEYALLITAGWPDGEIAQRAGWDSLKVGRVRKQLERSRTRLRGVLFDLVQLQQQKEAS